MVEKFRELKKKYVILAIIKGLIAGVFCALFAIGAVMLGIKLSANRLAWYYYLIIGFGTFAASFGITFLLTYHSDKSLAKKLDNEYNLKEKVQTMVEFSGQEGDILNIQREDTEKTLNNLPKKKISFAKIWQYVLIAVLGISLFLSGVLVTSKYEAPTPPDDVFVLDEWDIKALEQLIADVNASDLEETVKIPAISALETLKEELPNARTAYDMRSYVKSCAKAIDKAVILANTYRDVAQLMDKYEELNDFKMSIVNASRFYADSTVIDSLSKVKSEQKNAEEKIRTKLESFTKAFVADVKGAEGKVGIKDAVEALLDPLNDSLSEEDDLELVKIIEKIENDALYLALSDFSSALGVVKKEYNSRNEDDLKSIVNDACTDFVTAMSRELLVQAYNCMMDDMICNTLNSIFGTSVKPEELDLPGMSDDTGGSNDSPNGGGVGDKDVIYGGKDTVYDKETTSHVVYTKIWNDYVSKLNSKLNSEESGLSEEMEAYIRNYIKALEGTESDANGEN